MIQRLQDNLIRQSFSDFDEIRFVTAGAQKIVYKARQNDTFWALKLVPLSPGTEDESKAQEIQREIEARLEREIRIQRQATINSIVRLGPHPVREIYLNKVPHLYYTEEFLDGKDLRQLINEKFKPDLNELVNLSLSMLEAINFLCEKRCIHRDIKPGNIMKTSGKTTRFVLLDVGYALALGEVSLTKNAMIPGTIRYMSPEQLDVKRKRSLDFRSDLYSLGVTILEYACGKHPYVQEGDTITDVISAILHKKPLALNSQRNDLPQDFCVLVDRFLCKKRHLRPGKIQGICQKLSHVLTLYGGEDK